MTTSAPAPVSAPDRRAGITNGAFIAAFFVSYFAARFYVRDDLMPAVLRFVLCLLPAVIGAFTIRRIVAFVRSLADELERRIQLEAFAFAFPAGLIVSLALGFIDHSGLIHIDPWDYWFFHLPMYFLGLVIARCRYQ